MAQTKVLARIAALAEMKKLIGVREDPPGSNSGPMVRKLQASTTLKGTGWPWCAATVCYSFLKGGKALVYPTASVGELARWGRAQGYVVMTPAPGDISCFDFDGDGVKDEHVGMVESVDTRRNVIHTIEGNTALTNDANGGMVMRRERGMGSYITYVRIPGYVTVPSKAKATVKHVVVKAKAAKNVIPYVIKRRTFTNSGIVTGITTVEPRSTAGGKEIN